MSQKKPTSSELIKPEINPSVYGAIIVLVLIIIAGIIIFNNTKNNQSKNMATTSQNIVTKPNGLILDDLKVGTGKEVKTGDTIKAHYLGTLENGTKFDSSYDRGEPFEVQIGVGQVIPGWDEGIVGIKEGGKRKLTIPSALAYGDRGVPQAGILGGATLVFEVEVLEIIGA